MKNPLLVSLEAAQPRATLSGLALDTAALTRNDTHLRKRVVGLLAASLALGLLEIAMALWVNPYATVTAAMVLAGMAVTVGLTWEAWESAYSSRLLDAKGCAEVLDWARKCPKVLAYVRSVQEQRRSFCVADHALLREWFVEAHAKEQAQTLAQAEAEVLRRLLGGEDPLQG